MSEQNLELITTRNLFLKEGIQSSEILLKDTDGDMYFRMTLKYVGDEEDGRTQFEIIDPHHAAFIVETRPNAITRLASPYEIGTYQTDKTLYFDFTVQPRMESGEHEVTVSFYTNKENYGTEQER